MESRNSNKSVSLPYLRVSDFVVLRDFSTISERSLIMVNH